MPTRRQFLGSAAILGAAAATSAILSHHFYPPMSVRVQRVGLPLAHQLRDRAFVHMVPQRDFVCDTVIVGSGAAALSAAWYLHRAGKRDFLILEGVERNGNAAAYNFSGSLNAPSGAHYLPQPSAESVFVRELLADLGILRHNAQGRAVYDDMDLVHAPDERLFYQGKWQYGLMPHDADSQRFAQFIAQIQHSHGTDGKKHFAIPIAESSQDDTWRKCDTQTFAQWLAQENYTSPDLLWYLDYCCRDDYGQGIAQVSAYAGLHYFAARGNDQAAVLTWSDGLNHLAEKMRQHMGLQEKQDLPPSSHLHFRQPESWAASALHIKEHNDFVDMTVYHHTSQTTAHIRAQNVIVATPLFVAQHIVENMKNYAGDGFRLPESAPWLIGNFVLNAFPPELPHSELAWDNVVHGSSHLGYVLATHQSLRVAKPEQTIFTTYTALNHDTPQNVRKWLLQASDEALLHYAMHDLLTVYGKHFPRHVQHAELTVRGHAMAVPKVGYLSQSSLHQLRAHSSRLLFAHSDLSGYSVFEEAVYWGVQAAQKLLKMPF